MAKDKMKCAVVGVGYLGKFHAEKYAAMNDVELVGISDVNPKVAEIAKKHKCPYYQDYHELLDKCDLVSIVVPSHMHHKIGCEFLKAGVNCLVEKPFATTLEEAEEMKHLAEKQSVMLSVGHLERFNPVFQRLQKLCTKPHYINTDRLTKHSNRSMDINVVLDLMIHDLDLVLQLVDSKIKHMNCMGVNIISRRADAANSYITFENGTVANISVSRINFENLRKLRVFQPNLYVSADLHNHSYAVAKRLESGNEGMEWESHDLLPAKTDQLNLEIADCIAAVRNGSDPLITAESALETLRIALVMTAKIKETLGDTS